MGTSLTKLETYSNKKSLFVIVSCNETNINNITIKENNTNALELYSSIYFELKERKVNKIIKYAIHVLVFPRKEQSITELKLKAEKNETTYVVSNTITIDPSRNNFVYQTSFESEGKQDKYLISQYKMTPLEEFELYLKIMNTCPQDNNLWNDLYKDSLKQIEMSHNELFNFPFSLELFTSYYLKSPDMMENIFNYFDLQTKILPPSIYKEQYLSAIKSTYSQYKSNTNYLKFILCFFCSFPEHLPDFFKIIQNDNKDEILSYLISNKQAFTNLKVNHLCEFIKHSTSQEVLLQLFTFPLTLPEYLELILSEPVQEQLNKFNEQDEEPQDIQLDDLYPPSANDNIKQIIELYTKVKANNNLNKYFNFHFEISKYFELYIKQNISTLLYLYVYIKENNLNDLESDIINGINDTLIHFAKNSQAIDVDILIILSYFENNTSVLSDISQKISYNEFKFLIGNLFAKIKDFPGLIHIYSVLINMKNLKKRSEKSNS